MPRLVKFSERHPDIDVRIKAVDMDEGSLTDDVDVAIYYGRGNWPGLRSDKLHTEYLIPVCSPLLLTGPKPLRTPGGVVQQGVTGQIVRGCLLYTSTSSSSTA